VSDKPEQSAGALKAILSPNNTDKHINRRAIAKTSTFAFIIFLNLAIFILDESSYTSLKQ